MCVGHGTAAAVLPRRSAEHPSRNLLRALGGGIPEGTLSGSALPKDRVCLLRASTRAYRGPAVMLNDNVLSRTPGDVHCSMSCHRIEVDAKPDWVAR